MWCKGVQDSNMYPCPVTWEGWWELTCAMLIKNWTPASILFVLVWVEWGRMDVTGPKLPFLRAGPLLSHSLMTPFDNNIRVNTPLTANPLNLMGNEHYRYPLITTIYHKQWRYGKVTITTVMSNLWLLSTSVAIICIYLLMSLAFLPFIKIKKHFTAHELDGLV